MEMSAFHRKVDCVPQIIYRSLFFLTTFDPFVLLFLLETGRAQKFLFSQENRQIRSMYKGKSELQERHAEENIFGQIH